MRAIQAVTDLLGVRLTVLALVTVAVSIAYNLAR